MENCIALRDPVCGMAVTNKSFHQSEHMGQLFYFCGAKCKAKFVANAQRYSGEPGAAASAPEQAAPRLTFKWQRGWLLVLVGLLALVLGGVWLA